MTHRDLVFFVQKAMNRAGATPPLKEDGILGPKTFDASVSFKFTITAEKLPATELPKLGEGEKLPIPSDFFGASWVGANIDMLGREESDPVLNDRYVPEWALEGLRGYKTLAGNSHAWCSLRENADKRKVGVKGTNSAAASSWSKWGRKSPFWFGATLDIKHRGGGRHVGDFLYWIDEKKKIAAVLGGNQGNRFSIVANDLSGRGDTLVTGPRWPADLPDGQIVSMAEVLKRYPFLKVGGKGDGSTR